MNDCEIKPEKVMTASETEATTSNLQECTEEQQYYKSIDECAALATNQMIENSLPVHAKYLMTKMLSYANNRIRLFSGTLCQQKADGSGHDEQIYGSEELIAAAIDFLSRGKNDLCILVEHDIDGGVDSHPLIQAFKTMTLRKGTVEVRCLKDVELGNKRIPHFMIMDERAYRIEYDDKETKALANFGDFSRAKQWADYFDKTLFAKGKIVYQS